MASSWESDAGLASAAASSSFHLGAQGFDSGRHLVADPHHVADARAVQAGDRYRPHGRSRGAPEPSQPEVAVVDGLVAGAVFAPARPRHRLDRGGALPPVRWGDHEGDLGHLACACEVVRHGGGRGVPSGGDLQTGRGGEGGGVGGDAHLDGNDDRLGARRSGRAVGCGGGTLGLPVDWCGGAVGCGGGTARSRVAGWRARLLHGNHPHGGIDHDRQGGQHLDRARHRSVRQPGHGGGEGGGVHYGCPLHNQVDGNRQGGSPPRKVQVRRVGHLVVVLREPVPGEVRRGRPCVGVRIGTRLGHAHRRFGRKAIPRRGKAGSPAQHDPGAVDDPGFRNPDSRRSGHLDHNSDRQTLTRHNHRACRSPRQSRLDPKAARGRNGVFELPLLQAKLELGLGGARRGRDRGAQQTETPHEIRHGLSRSAEVEPGDDLIDQSLKLRQRRAGLRARRLAQ